MAKRKDLGVNSAEPSTWNMAEDFFGEINRLLRLKDDARLDNEYQDWYDCLLALYDLISFRHVRTDDEGREVHDPEYLRLKEQIKIEMSINDMMLKEALKKGRPLSETEIAHNSQNLLEYLRQFDRLIIRALDRYKMLLPAKHKRGGLNEMREMLGIPHTRS